MEWWFYSEMDQAPVSTFEFHEYREQASHAEMYIHRPRMDRAAELVHSSIETEPPPSLEQYRVTITREGRFEHLVQIYDPTDPLFGDDHAIRAWTTLTRAGARRWARRKIRELNRVKPVTEYTVETPK